MPACIYGARLDAKHIKHVCFTGWTTTCSSRSFTELEDIIARDVAEQHGLLGRARSYRYAQQTLAAIYKGMRKYDTPLLPEPPALAVAFKDCMSFLGCWIRPTVPLRVVDLPADTSPGAQIKRNGIGIKTKLEFLELAGSYLEWYLDVGYTQETVLWNVVCKRELKPAEKLAADDVRLFVVPPTHFLCLQNVCCGDLDQQMKDLANDPGFPIKIGIVMQHGGFQQQINAMKRRFPYLVSSDVSKFDGAFALFLMMYVYMVRMCLQDRSVSLDHLHHVFRVLTNALVLLPTGEIVRLLQGHLSGSGTTGHDGSIGHLLFVFTLCRVLGLVYGEDLVAIIGADDIVYASRRPLPLKARVAVYAMFGWQLKVDEDVMRGNTADGISFYGMTYHEDVDGGYPVHSKPDKVISALVQLESPRDLDQLVMADRILNLRQYCAFDDVMWAFVESLRERYSGVIPWDDYVVPSRQHYQRVLWRDVLTTFGLRT